MATKIKKGDRVVVLWGKDAGEKGKVIRVLPKENAVVVEAERANKIINRIVKHQKPRQTTRATPSTQTGRIEMPAPLTASKVMVICPNCEVPSRMGTVIHADGTKSRVCKKCNKEIDGT